MHTVSCTAHSGGHMRGRYTARLRYLLGWLCPLRGASLLCSILYSCPCLAGQLCCETFWSRQDGLHVFLSMACGNSMPAAALPNNIVRYIRTQTCASGKYMVLLFGCLSFAIPHLTRYACANALLTGKLTLAHSPQMLLTYIWSSDASQWQ